MLLLVLASLVVWLLWGVYGMVFFKVFVCLMFYTFGPTSKHFFGGFLLFLSGFLEQILVSIYKATHKFKRMV